MARAPVDPAPIKTRLAAAIPDPGDRVALYRAFLSDMVSTCRRVERAALRIACTPPAGGERFEWAGVDAGEVLPQRGGDLGERERHLFADLFAAGFDRVIVIGSDLPTLPASRLREALDLLTDSARVVLGPAEDGGYFLIGLRADNASQRVPDVFSGIRWSTPHALEDTLKAASRENLQAVLIAPWYDVDDVAGLQRLRADLRDAAIRARTPATAAALRAICPEP